MPANNPLFSIITVTYNAAATVGRTLESVARQSFGDYEHIVVDGRSSDGTLDIVGGYKDSGRLVHLSEPDHGIYDAMNKGIGLARGTYLIFLNAGDKFHSDTTLESIAAATADKPGIVYGQTDIVDDEGRYVGPRHLTAPAQLRYEDFAQGMLVCHQAFVVLKRIAPLYDVKYRFSADYDWCIQCLQHSRRNAYVGDTLIDYLQAGVTTSNRRKSLAERFRIMCYYYGTLPTVLRHMRFAARFLRNKFSGKPYVII